MVNNEVNSAICYLSSLSSQLGGSLPLRGKMVIEVAVVEFLG
jgi:hypothetical protein